MHHDAELLKNAVDIGCEWLGAQHPAVECLNLGLAVHHGQLPRPFQRAVEKLLRDGILTVTIASPTLAQGLNLSATTVLFYSVYRAGELITGEEFANVGGRAGRAFVDVEGQVLCAAWERKHVIAWNKVVSKAKHRDLTSGMLQLVSELCLRLATKTGFSLAELTEYVLNNAAAWDAPLASKDEPNAPVTWATQLACLDSALLSLIQHDAGAEDLATALDAALKSSLWERSLQREDEQIISLSCAVLVGRSQLIWRESTAEQRKGFSLPASG